MSRTPIRLRLTAWYALALVGLLLALGTFVVTRLRSDLTSELDRSLRSAAGQIALGYHLEGAAELRDTAATVLPGPRGRGSGAQVLDADGHVLLADGDPLLRAPLIGTAAVARVLGGAVVVSSRRVGTPPEHLRVVAVAVRRGDRRQVLVAAESLAEVDRSAHRVLLLLVISGSAALVLISLGGWWIARTALRPVERMATRADRIGIADLSQRIVVPAARDEIGHLARTLNAMLDRLQAGVDARERLIADASHELRAPLAAMRAEVEVSLRRDALDDAARAVLESARDEVLRMARIVDNLLTLARVDQDRLELLPAPQDLREVAERSVRAQRAAAAVAGVELVVEGPPALVIADGDRVEQVLTNLIDNAIRFTPPGGSVSVSVDDDGDDEARITVRDGGPGVPADRRERIFERFSREDPSRPPGGGAGLGLAISLEIARAHGGRIWVEGGDGGGSAFVVALPRDGRPMTPATAPRAVA